MAMHNDYTLETYTTKTLHQLSNQSRIELANCYRDVFNESWGESWTTASALDEINRILSQADGRKPIIAVLLFRGSIVGFTLGSILHRDQLSLDFDMPPELTTAKKAEGYAVAQYWLRHVVANSSLCVWSHTGIIKGRRNNRLYSMALPLYQYASKLDCKVLLMWTSVKSPAFKLALSIGLYPIHYFISGNLCLIGGDVSKVRKLMETALQKNHARAAYREGGQRIKHYLCQ